MVNGDPLTAADFVRSWRELATPTAVAENLCTIKKSNKMKVDDGPKCQNEKLGVSTG